MFHRFAELGPAPKLVRALVLDYDDFGYAPGFDTEGELAVDVFYLTASNRPLEDPLKARLAEELTASIQTLRPAVALAR